MKFPLPLVAALTLAAAPLAVPQAAKAYPVPAADHMVLYAEVGANDVASRAFARDDLQTACTALGHAAHYEDIYNLDSHTRDAYHRNCTGRATGDYPTPSSDLRIRYAEVGALAVARRAEALGDRPNVCTALGHAAHYESVLGETSDSRARYRQRCDD